MTEIMLDSETLGREGGCAVLSIGAVIFDPRALPLAPPLPVSSVFYRTLDLTSQVMRGFKIDPDTLEWWQNQDKGAQDALSKVTAPIDEVLRNFVQWCNDMGVDRVWCQGANFDAPIIGKAIEMVGLTVPWKFYEVRDTRTVYDLCDFDPKSIARKGTYHNALDDAQHQIKCVQAALQKGLKKKVPEPAIYPGGPIPRTRFTQA